MAPKREDSSACAFCGYGVMQEMQVKRKTKAGTNKPQLIILICPICGAEEFQNNTTTQDE